MCKEMSRKKDSGQLTPFSAKTCSKMSVCRFRKHFTAAKGKKGPGSTLLGGPELGQATNGSLFTSAIPLLLGTECSIDISGLG